MKTNADKNRKLKKKIVESEFKSTYWSKGDCC